MERENKQMYANFDGFIEQTVSFGLVFVAMEGFQIEFKNKFTHLWQPKQTFIKQN